MRKKLPIGIQTFAEIRQEGHYYVDKTPLLLRLVREGSFYFLSRPRRFGKSLLIDTLAELFEGNRPLFDGLHAEAHWDWSKSYPVIRISFADGVLHSAERLQQRILEHAQARGVRGFVADILPSNTKMIALAKKATDHITVEKEDDSLHVTMMFE